MPLYTELPTAIVPWTVAPHGAVLLIHDMQKYCFVGVSPRPFPASETDAERGVAAPTKQIMPEQ